MNCNTCRYELSQCLDGRLPSGRRATVLAHAEACDACGQFWNELQAAQQLTLSLHEPQVNGDFRDSLWERIHAGEGTPDAVFVEPVPAWTKVRYALTGAAAAAALLVGASLLQQEAGPQPRIDERATTRAPAHSPAGAQPVAQARDTGALLRDRSPAPTYTQNALLANAQPLTLQVLASEAASQLEQRYQEASIGLRMMREPGNNRAAAARRVVDSANELRDLGQLLIDLRQRERLVFTDQDVDRDLSFAVEWLERVPALSEHSPEVIETYYAPALAKQRLAEVKDHIGLRLAADPVRELHELKELNSRRPEVFPKLFFVLGDMTARPGDLSRLSPNMVLVEGACGPNWVAPRSEVSRHDTMLRVFGDQGQVRFEVEVRQGR